jgi:hypothetical protein
VRAAVENGHETFGALWLGGGRLRAERTRTWLATHGAHMRAVLGVSRGPTDP